MTHRSDNRSFEDAIDSAVHDMHRHMPRGNQPSARVWNQVRQAAGVRDIDARSSEVIEPREASHQRRNQPSRGALPGVIGSGQFARSKSHLSWTTWLAAALIVVLLGTNFYLLTDNGDDNGTGQSIALAPGTPDTSTLEPLGVDSPPASPELYIPVYGPEFACEVEPLTVDEVYQIVLNPGSGWTAKDPNFNHSARGFDYSRRDLYEGDDRWSDIRRESDARSSYEATDEPSITEPIIETANTFWNCIMTGTAFQVWALLEPSAVQHEILKLYPVLRDEATLRKHIEEWGPRKYSAGLYHTFPDLGNTPPYDASMHVDETFGSIRVGYSQGEPWKAVVRMVNHPESEWIRENDILLVVAPDGTWWVSMIFYDG